MSASDKVVIGLTHNLNDSESVLIAYLMAVEAVRKDKQAVMWLTKDGVDIATPGYVEKIEVPGAPSITGLHEEFVKAGGRFFACPVCIKTHNLEEVKLIEGAEAKGAPAIYEFSEGGALIFNY